MEIFFQLTACQRELSFPTAKVKREIEANMPEPQELPPLLSVTPMMERRLESDFHPEPERLSSDPAELWSELLLEVKEPTSHSLRLTPPGTRQRVRETIGQELEVLQ